MDLSKIDFGDIKELTKKGYIATIHRLFDLVGSNDLEDVKKTKKFIKFITEDFEPVKGRGTEQTKGNSTRLKFLYMLMFLTDKLGYKKANKKYYDAWNKLKNEEKKVSDIDPQLKRNWLPWNKIMTLPDKLSFEKSPRDYLIAMLYTHQPPMRLDYADLRVVRKHPNPSVEYNHVVVNNSNVEFFIKGYKTESRYGTLRWKAPVEVARAIRSYVKNFKPEEIYYNKRKADTKDNYLLGAMSESNLADRIKKLFQEYFNRTLTVTDLRKIWTTEITLNPKYKELSKDVKEKLHNQLAHSTGTAEAFYVKDAKKGLPIEEIKPISLIEEDSE